MIWQYREIHVVGDYTFHWFAEESGGWLVGVWRTEGAPENANEAVLSTALTLHHISRAENPKGSVKPVREFCERFMSDIPFRVRAIRSKIPTLRGLERAGLLPPDTGTAIAETP